MTEHWRVTVSSIGENILISCGNSFIHAPFESEYVEPPTYLERLRGITHQMKVDKAFKRVQNTCDRKNAESKRGKELVAGYRGGSYDTN